MLRTLVLATSNGKRLIHEWMLSPCDGECGGTCPACALNVAMCRVCGLDTYTSNTTHCPGEDMSDELVARVIEITNLDFINGEWKFKEARAFIDTETGDIHKVSYAGNIDLLVEHAEQKMRITQNLAKSMKSVTQLHNKVNTPVQIEAWRNQKNWSPEN